jgi:hypothetical protein
MSKRTCETCGCWHPCDEYSSGRRLGECRAGRPELHFEVEHSYRGYWPDTVIDDWCGEHTGLRPAELPGPNRGDA